MQHLEEGTIHAWLDGALSADESARVEQHVNTCAECAAMVADARGLIAGAARIVSALDIVPGGVIPAKTPATTAKRSLWHTLRLSPFRAAMAASVMIAVASLFAVKADKVVTPIAESAAPAMAPAPVAPGPARTVASATAPAPSTPAARAQNKVSDQRVDKKRERDMAQGFARTTQPAEAVPSPKVATADSVRSNIVDSLRVQSMRKSMPTALSEVVVTSADAARRPAATPVPDTARAATGAAAGGGRGGRGSAIAGGVARAAQATEAAREQPFARQLSAPLASANATEFVGCYQISDSTSWPRELPTRFALTIEPNPAGGQPRNLVRGRDSRGRADTVIAGAWRQMSPTLVAVGLGQYQWRESFTLTRQPSGLMAQPLQTTTPVSIAHTACP